MGGTPTALSGREYCANTPTQSRGRATPGKKFGPRTLPAPLLSLNGKSLFAAHRGAAILRERNYGPLAANPVTTNAGDRTDARLRLVYDHHPGCCRDLGSLERLRLAGGVARLGRP